MISNLALLKDWQPGNTPGLPTWKCQKAGNLLMLMGWQLDGDTMPALSYGVQVIGQMAVFIDSQLGDVTGVIAWRC